jgi:hypothetical protein
MSLRKKLNKLFDERPEYKISEEYSNNQGLARNAAFGRDRSIMAQENNLEQQSADAIGVASQYSNSASGILATLSSITDSKNQALRNLAGDEAAIQRTKMQDLYGANVAMAEEQDKAFEYNVNTPYQKTIERLQERKRRRQGITDALTGASLTIGSTAATSGQTNNSSAQSSQGGGADGAFGFLGKIFSDPRLKKNSEPSRYGLNEVLDLKVMEYEYITDPAPQRHIGLMADNVLELLPEAVDQKGKYLKIDYNEIVPVLIKAMQEQNQQIKLLEQQISELKQSA